MPCLNNVGRCQCRYSNRGGPCRGVRESMMEGHVGMWCRHRCKLSVWGWHAANLSPEESTPLHDLSQQVRIALLWCPTQLTELQYPSNMGCHVYACNLKARAATAGTDLCVSDAPQHGHTYTPVHQRLPVALQTLLAAAAAPAVLPAAVRGAGSNP